VHQERPSFRACRSTHGAGPTPSFHRFGLVASSGFHQQAVIRHHRLQAIDVGVAVGVEGRQQAAAGAEDAVGERYEAAVRPGIDRDPQQRAKRVGGAIDAEVAREGDVGARRAAADAGVTVDQQPSRRAGVALRT